MKYENIMKHYNMKNLIYLVIAIFLSSCGNTKQPNILLIVADDLGWKDVGFMGSEFYETPNLDKLAGEGVVFNQAYAGAANCAPSRACLLSGENTPRHGIYTVNSSVRGNARTRRLIPTKNNTVLGDEFITLAEELQKAGYVTASMGKWHIGDSPLSQGFDLNYGGGKWGHPAGYFAPFKYPEIEADEGDNLTDLISARAIRFIRENVDRPFFLYIPFYAVHSPLQGKAHLVEKFRKKGGNELQHNAKYAAMIATMDSCVGAIIREVDDLNLRKKTLILFTSDNGGVFNISLQNPLRGGKGSYYEGGIRVPLVVSWPGEIEPGIDEKTIVANLDYYPTLLDFLGVEPMNTMLDGISFKNVLLSSKGDEATVSTPEPHALYFHFPVYLEANKGNVKCGRDVLFRTRPGSVIRFGDWKLHWYFEDNALELYNLSTDIGEEHNLAETHPEKAQELLQMLKSWIEETGAPVPTEINSEFDPEFERGKSELRVREK